MSKLHTIGMVSTRLAAMAAIAVLSTSTASCTNQKLVPIAGDEPQVVDDLVEVDASFCTRPAQDVAFPVKLLLIVDTSGSMQFTDQPGLRVNAIRQLVNSLRPQNNVLISTMGFGSNVYLEPQVTSPTDPLFEPAASWNEPDFLTLKDVTTDYEGALDAAKQHILLDMLRSDPAELARTKYVVIFFSDGSPDPKCCISSDETVGGFGGDPYGCPLESWEAAAPGVRYCEDTVEFNLCNQSDFLDQFRNGVDGVVGGSGQPDYGNGVLNALDSLQLEGNYNRSYQLEGLVQDMMDLGKQFGVGQIQFNTALLFDDQLPDGVKQIYQLNKCRSESLLRSMATIGNGQFRDFEGSGQIDFLSFNFTSLKQGFTLIDTYAMNVNALPPTDPTNNAYRPDSDGDGLDDAQEFELGTDATVRDSDKQVGQTPPSVCAADIDCGLGGTCAVNAATGSGACVPAVLTDPATWGDGYNDNFEQQRVSIGFDPRFQSRPLQPCPASSIDLVDSQDLDGDGLNGCEENVLGTDPKLADSDGDSLTDGQEVRLGLDPNVAEANRDDDFDGTPNLEEVRKGRDPHVPDADREQSSIRYELVENGHTEDGRTCYTSIARGVHLATTQPRFTGGRRGYNDLLYFIAEAPEDNPTGRIDMRVACVRTQYVAPSFKDPIQGVVTLQESDFKDLTDPTFIQFLSDGGDFCTGAVVH